jgi:hypothetical protein
LLAWSNIVVKKTLAASVVPALALGLAISSCTGAPGAAPGASPGSGSAAPGVTPTTGTGSNTSSGGTQSPTPAAGVLAESTTVDGLKINSGIICRDLASLPEGGLGMLCTANSKLQVWTSTKEAPTTFKITDPEVALAKDDPDATYKLGFTGSGTQVVLARTARNGGLLAYSLASGATTYATASVFAASSEAAFGFVGGLDAARGGDGTLHVGLGTTSTATFKSSDGKTWAAGAVSAVTGIYFAIAADDTGAVHVASKDGTNSTANSMKFTRKGGTANSASFAFSGTGGGVKGVAVSSDGQKILAWLSTGLNVSTNGGSTFTAAGTPPNKQDLTAVWIRKDGGMRLAAKGADGKLHVHSSTDGATWTDAGEVKGNAYLTTSSGGPVVLDSDGVPWLLWSSVLGRLE